MTFGEFIRNRRARLGLMQADVARAIGRPDSYVSRLENDRFKELPSPDEMLLLAEVLKCSEADLLRAAGYLKGGQPELDIDLTDPDVQFFANHVGEMDREQRDAIVAIIRQFRRQQAQE